MAKSLLTITQPRLLQREPPRAVPGSSLPLRQLETTMAEELRLSMGNVEARDGLGRLHVRQDLLVLQTANGTPSACKRCRLKRGEGAEKAVYSYNSSEILARRMSYFCTYFERGIR